MLLSGDLAYASQTTTYTGSTSDHKASALSFNPAVGLQFTESITGGIVAGIGSSTTTSGVEKDNQRTFVIGPFVRYTKKISDLFSVYGQLQAGFGSSTARHTGSFTEETKVTTTEIGLFPALFINIKKGFGLNFSIGGIGYSTAKQDNGYTTNTFALSFGKTVSIGISKNFSLQKK